MRSGGIRRLYIPGELAFPKGEFIFIYIWQLDFHFHMAIGLTPCFFSGLASAPGRPRISAFSPVVFDVKLLYIPGLE